jgi:hypothetical protein
MKKLIPFLTFILLAYNTFSQETVRSHLVQIKGSVKIIYTYKGGAPPPEELIEKLKQPVALANTELFLKRSYYSDIVFVLKTDSLGKFEMKIKPGVYNIYLTNENNQTKKPLDKNDTDAVCEENFKMQSHGTLKIYKKGNSPLEITISEKRNPCNKLIEAAHPAKGGY